MFETKTQNGHSRVQSDETREDYDFKAALKGSGDAALAHFLDPIGQQAVGGARLLLRVVEERRRALLEPDKVVRVEVLDDADARLGVASDAALHVAFRAERLGHPQVRLVLDVVLLQRKLLRLQQYLPHLGFRAINKPR